MIAAIRVCFTPTPTSAIWNDALFANWLNPSHPYSLAHYWLKSSFGIADLRFQIFPPVVMDDPRLTLSDTDRLINAKSRPALVNGIIAKVTDSFHPDWSTIDGLLIWGAQDKTDLFGGGSYGLPLPIPDQNILEDFLFGDAKQQYKHVPVAVCDVASPFDAVCQELGHAYGFEHSFSRTRVEYGDPYDSMAGELYGGFLWPVFLRPVDPGLPVGIGDGGDIQRNIGPHISAAQLSISPFKDELRAAGMFIDVPPSYVTGASSFTLHALDDAIAHFPGQTLPILAVIPPVLPGGDTYFLELRRNGGYDSGLNVDASKVTDPPRPPVGVVIHSYDRSLNRIVYFDVLPLAGNRGDRDYHLFGDGHFTFRVTNIGEAFKTVGITIGGPDFWRHFGINLEDPAHEELGTTQTDWTKAEVSPCFLFAPGDYFYFYKYTFNRYTIVASSFGYEQPAYVWTVNGTVLNPAAHTANITTNVEMPLPAGKSIATKPVTIAYTIGGDRLTIGCNPDVGNFSLFVEVKSVETSPSVLKNVYEDKTIVTSVGFKNVKLEWDANYKNALKACEDALERVNEKHIPPRTTTRPTPEDPFLRVQQVETLINEFASVSIDIGLGVANAVVGAMAQLGNIVKGQFSKRQ